MSRHNNVQNLKEYTASYHQIGRISIYFPKLQVWPWSSSGHRGSAAYFSEIKVNTACSLQVFGQWYVFHCFGCGPPCWISNETTLMTRWEMLSVGEQCGKASSRRVSVLVIILILNPVVLEHKIHTLTDCIQSWISVWLTRFTLWGWKSASGRLFQSVFSSSDAACVSLFFKETISASWDSWCRRWFQVRALPPP